MTHATRIARALKRNGVAGSPVCARPRRCSGNAKRGELRRGQQRASEVCTRVFPRLAEAVPEGKAIAYRRSTSRKVLGVMPMCRVNTAVK
jgi:hypothetical protein